MDAWGNRDMVAHFSMLYRAKLPSLLRELTVAEDSSRSFIRLMKKKREARQMEKALAEKKEEFRERMEVTASQWRDLHAKKAQLKAHVMRSERVIQESEEVRIRSLKRASKETEERLQNDGEFLRAKIELETFRKEHQKLHKKVQKYLIFKKYLEDVVMMSQLEDIPGVTSHYKFLVRTHKDLLQSQLRHKDLTEQAKVFLEQYRAEKESEMLQYKSELVQLKLRFDQAQRDIRLWETHWADIQSRTAGETGKLGTIKLAIHNIFQSADMWLKEKWNVPLNDSHRQLDMAQNGYSGTRSASAKTGRSAPPGSTFCVVKNKKKFIEDRSSWQEISSFRPNSAS
ncbi:PREDICTED: coiled-coil domain-containing protein 42A-like [Acanthisitta chloris]|nr:PREDICTED: coiled-coil domain-containing protein 42A-like [Acanthisitta chloris]